MSIEDRNLQQDEAGLWEMGAALPFDNMNMARFEQQISLSRDVFAGNAYFYIGAGNTRIKPLSRIYIGPSSDPARDGNGDFISYKQTEVFKIESIQAVGAEDRINIAPLEEGFPNRFEHSYMSGDPVIFRPLAESWQYISEDQFAGINTLVDPKADLDFLYSREDSICEFKTFSQGIKCGVDFPTAIDMGISQLLSGKKAAILQLLKNKTCMVSAWIRFQNGRNFREAVQVKTQVDPYIFAAFYSNQDGLKANAIPGFTFIYAAATDVQWAAQAQGRILVPSNALAIRTGVYGTFRNDSHEEIKDYTETVPTRLWIDDVVVEHAAETTNENNGRYLFNSNPAVGISVSSIKRGQNEASPSGIIRKSKVGDPTLKLEISAKWQYQPSFFINDMLRMEKWNLMGFPIALRTKMPGILPNVVFCNIEVFPSHLPLSTAKRVDVEIKFREITV